MKVHEVISYVYLFTGANVGFESLPPLTPNESPSSIDVCLEISNVPAGGSEVDISVTLVAISGTALGE